MIAGAILYAKDAIERCQSVVDDDTFRIDARARASCALMLPLRYMMVTSAMKKR